MRPLAHRWAKGTTWWPVTARQGGCTKRLQRFITVIQQQKAREDPENSSCTSPRPQMWDRALQVPRGLGAHGRSLGPDEPGFESLCPQPHPEFLICTVGLFMIRLAGLWPSLCVADSRGKQQGKAGPATGVQPGGPLPLGQWLSTVAGHYNRLIAGSAS